MMHDHLWNNNNTAAHPLGFRPTKSAPCSPIKPLLRTRSDSFHVAHKVPVGDTPYVKAKHVQLVDKDPEKAIALFWAAINAGDRVDSALKDMAIVMKQQNRAEEAIEAIKSLRGRCSEQAQESLDNILLDLYKKCGRLDDQIALLKHKLFLIQQGLAFNGKRTKTARSQGKKFQVSVEQEATRLLGNLGWAYMQQNSYIEAEAAYTRALSVAPDNNKMCNLGICLMKQGRIAEAKDTLRQVRPAVADGPRGVDSHLKAFERAQEMLRDLESEIMIKAQDKFNQSQLFDAFLGSSSIWQPQPCVEQSFIPPSLPKQQDDGFGDENLDLNRIVREGVLVLREKQPPPGFPPLSQKKTNKSMAMNLPPPFFTQPASKHLEEVSADENLDLNRLLRAPPLHKVASEKTMCLQRNFLNIDAPPFYSKLSMEQPIQHTQFLDPLSSLKRTRSGKIAAAPAREEETHVQSLVAPAVDIVDQPEQKSRRRSLSSEGNEENKWLGLLPDNKELEDAIVAAIVAPYKEKKRFKVFQDITASSLSPRA